MKRKPTVFLDIDGVLSTYNNRNNVVFDGAEVRGQKMSKFLRMIDADLVISSNWRYGHTRKGISSHDLQELIFDYTGLTYPISDMTPLLPFISDDYFERDMVILAYAEDVGGPWIAFDDMPLERIPEQHKITTDPRKGITDNDIRTAIKRLDSQL